MQKKIKELSLKYKDDFIRYNELVTSDDFRKEGYTEILKTRSEEMAELMLTKEGLQDSI